MSRETKDLNHFRQVQPVKKGFHLVNELNMYYELYGELIANDNCIPLVLIHGGGSTIDSSFGRLLPAIASKRVVLALELQAHGRSGDRNGPLSFKQDAADVCMLLLKLGIKQADILGFSNGGQTALEISLSYPDLVRKQILASIFYKREAAAPQFWEGLKHATLDDIPMVLIQAFLEVNPNEKALQNMFEKDVFRMMHFTGWTDEQVRSIKSPTLIVQANKDVGSLEHALEMHRVIKQSELVILPGGHGTYMGAIDALAGKKWTMPYFADLLLEFLDRSE